MTDSEAKQLTVELIQRFPLTFDEQHQTIRWPEDIELGGGVVAYAHQQYFGAYVVTDQNQNPWMGLWRVPWADPGCPHPNVRVRAASGHQRWVVSYWRNGAWVSAVMKFPSVDDALREAFRLYVAFTPPSEQCLTVHDDQDGRVTRPEQEESQVKEVFHCGVPICSEVVFDEGKLSSTPTKPYLDYRWIELW